MHCQIWAQAQLAGLSHVHRLHKTYREQATWKAWYWASTALGIVVTCNTCACTHTQTQTDWVLWLPLQRMRRGSILWTSLDCRSSYLHSTCILIWLLITGAVCSLLAQREDPPTWWHVRWVDTGHRVCHVYDERVLHHKHEDQWESQHQTVPVHGLAGGSEPLQRFSHHRSHWSVAKVSAQQWGWTNYCAW